MPNEESIVSKENNIKRSLGQPVQIRIAQMKQTKQTRFTAALLRFLKLQNLVNVCSGENMWP